MTVDREGIALRMRSRPPRCLAALDAAPTAPPESWDFCDLTTWALSCRCGERMGGLLGHPLKRYNAAYSGAAFVGPLAFECSKCATVGELLDSARHGYHAEVGSSACHISGVGLRERFSCPCGGRRFAVVATFFFWEAAIDLIEEEPDRLPSAENCFNEFQAHGRCTACDRVSRFTDFGKF